MEPVTSIVSAILVVLQEIANAERVAHRNRTRCRDLAERAQAVSNVLREARTTAGGASSGTKRIILRRLREALDDALKLVRSCGQRVDDSRRRLVLSWLSARLYSRARAARFDDINKRINNCLADLNTASSVIIEKKVDSLVAAAERTKKPIKETKAGNVPQQKGRATGKGGQQNGGKGIQQNGEKDGKKNGGKDVKKNGAKGSQQNGGKNSQQSGGKGGKSTRGKNKAAAGARPPALALARARFPPFWLSVDEEDPTSCSVM